MVLRGETMSASCLVMCRLAVQNRSDPPAQCCKQLEHNWDNADRSVVVGMLLVASCEKDEYHCVCPRCWVLLNLA